jgi:hypothetical protein
MSLVKDAEGPNYFRILPSGFALYTKRQIKGRACKSGIREEERNFVVLVLVAKKSRLLHSVVLENEKRRNYFKLYRILPLILNLIFL